MESEDRQLSDRERTVLLLAAEGLTDKAIARHLDLSQRTIGTYWERMRLKLGHYSRTQLVARFLRTESETEPYTLRYRSLFATWDEGAWILSCEGRTIYANHRIGDLFGLTVEEFEKTDVRRLFEKATSTTLDAVISAAEKAPHEIEFRLERQGDATVWLKLRGTMARNVQGECTAIILLLNDVTVQKRIKYTLDTCESTLRFVFEHGGDPMARFDAEGRCVQANAAFLRAVDRRSDEVVMHSIADLAGTLEPNRAWRKGFTEALGSGSEQSFDSDLGAHGGEGRREKETTHLLPVPSEDRQPGTVLSLTIRTPSPERRS